MRIAAFEVREDEREAFGRMAQVPGVEKLALFSEKIDRGNLGVLAGFDAVLVLGANNYDKDFLIGIAEQNVRVLVGRTVGLDYVDVDAARAVGLATSNVAYAPDSVADFTLMLILVTLRKYKPAIYLQNVNDFALDGLMGRTLSSLTVGIVGTGAIGSAVAERLAGFGPTILAFGHHQNPRVAELGEYVSLDELYAKSDLITFHIPERPENHHMVCDETLACMRDGVVLVNTARAGIMDVNTLVRGIESGKIGALAMDVFDGEQDIYHKSLMNEIISNRDMAYLRQFPNTVLTQHMAFYTAEAVNEMVEKAVAKALELGRRG